MIRGQVQLRQDGARLEAKVTIDIAGDDRLFRSVEAVIDTGFTGALSLPESAAHELGLHSARAERVTLADGRSIRANVHAARILWHGQPLDARVQTLGTYAMIGTALLANCRLTIDWWDGGDVIIEEQTPPAQ